MKALRPDKNNVLILIVGGLSLINIVPKFQTGNYPSAANSLIGLLGVALFFFKKDAFRYAIWIWIAAQAIIIEHIIRDNSSNDVIKKATFDLSQLLYFKLGFYTSSNGNSYGLNFNVVVLLYFFLFRNLKTSSLIGKNIRLLFMKGNLNLDAADGSCATLSRRVDLNGDDNWLLGELSSNIRYNQTTYDRVLVHTEDGLLTHTFRIVPVGAAIAAGVNPLLQFERAEWIMIE